MTPPKGAAMGEIDPKTARCPFCEQEIVLLKDTTTFVPHNRRDEPFRTIAPGVMIANRCVGSHMKAPTTREVATA